jgi:hypothetical protein
MFIEYIQQRDCTRNESGSQNYTEMLVGHLQIQNMEGKLLKIPGKLKFVTFNLHALSESLHV